MDNTDTFLSLYNDLDDLLRKRYNDFDKGKSMIMRYSLELEKSNYRSTCDRGKTLDSIRVLRNALVHDLDMNGDELISIEDKTINFLNNEIVLLTNPIKASDIFTPISRMFVASLYDQVGDIIKIMVERGYMQVPVVDNQKRLLGVFSPNVIFKNLYEAKQLGLNKSSQMMMLKDYIALDKHISEKYEFVARGTPFETISSTYDKYYQIGKKLVVIFVTEHGLQDESILGMITPYDVVNAKRK